jgi:hypothetical protein
MVSRCVTRAAVRAVPTAASTRPVRPTRRRPRSRCAARSGPAERRWHRQPRTRPTRRERCRPPGPPPSITDFACATCRSVSGPTADSCSASTVPPEATSSSIRWVSAAVDSTPSTDGMYARRDCCAAARATARQRRRPLSARAPSQRATQRAACQATSESAPASVASSMASSERSDFGSAWTTVTGWLDRRRPANAPRPGPADRRGRSARRRSGPGRRRRRRAPAPRVGRMRRTVAA